jgi:hypothetical protein
MKTLKVLKTILNSTQLLLFVNIMLFCSFQMIGQSTSPQFIVGNDTLVAYRNVPGLTPSDKYTIRVKSAATGGEWVDVFAHYTYNRAVELGGVPIPTRDGRILGATVMNYALHTKAWSHTYGNIEMSDNQPVVVEIGIKAGFQVRNLPLFKATVHPHQKSSPATLSEGKIYFTITKPGQLVIDINGQMDDFNAGVNGGHGFPVHAISIFANPVIKKPLLTNPRTYYVEPGLNPVTLRDINPTTFDTIYFKPGVHDLGQDIKIYPGKVVYISGDALIYGNMNNIGVPNGGFPRNGQDIRIYGYGTLSSAKIVHGDYLPPSSISSKGLEIQNGTNWRIHGITVVDPANHSIYTIGGTNGLISYTKVISWRANGDGIGGYEPAIDCFIRTQDDCSYVKGYKARCTFWKDANAALFHMANIDENGANPLIIEDCDVIYARLRSPVGPNSLSGNGGGFNQRGEGVPGQRSVNVIIRNFRIHDKLVNMPIINMASFQGTAAAPSKIGSSYKGILFQNIAIAGMVPKYKQIILGCAAAPWFGGLIFDNLTIGGIKVTTANHQTYFNTNEFVKYLLFDMPKPVTLTTIVDAIKGTVTRDPDQATYLETSTVTLNAKGNTGYVFSHWSGDITGTVNPIEVVVDKNMTITANFTDPDFSKPISISAPGSGGYIIPAGVTSVTARIWGAGGAGGSASNRAVAMQARGGGGAGGGFATVTTAVTAGQVLRYTIGAGGSAAPVGFINNTAVAVQNGGNSTITLDSNRIAFAQGGPGGINIAGSTSTTGAAGAGVNALKSGNVGDIVFYGGNGAGANANGTGGGGGSAGTSGHGGDAPTPPFQGSSMGIAGAGGGANGGVGFNSTKIGNPGGTPGAGGSGAAVRGSVNNTIKGGDGADGAMILTFVVTPLFSAPQDSYCYGDILAPLPTTSNNGITGTWNPALNNVATTTYTFTPTAGQTAISTTLTLVIGGVTTWNGTSWSNSAPTSSTRAIIAGNYEQATNLTACSLEAVSYTHLTLPTTYC